VNINTWNQTEPYKLNLHPRWDWYYDTERQGLTSSQWCGWGCYIVMLGECFPIFCRHQSFEMPATSHPLIQCHILEDLNPQSRELYINQTYAHCPPYSLITILTELSELLFGWREGHEGWKKWPIRAMDGEEEMRWGTGQRELQALKMPLVKGHGQQPCSA
jgi:hypothetical protein